MLMAHPFSQTFYDKAGCIGDNDTKAGSSSDYAYRDGNSVLSNLDLANYGYKILPTSVNKVRPPQIWKMFERKKIRL